MPVEPRYSYIDDLDNTSPRGQEPLSDVDDHLRGTKSVLKTQWPNLGDNIVTPDAAGLSSVGGRVVGWGGMARNDGNNTFTGLGNTERQMTAFNAVSFATNDRVIATPNTGVLQVTGMNTLSDVRLNLSLTLMRLDSAAHNSGALIKVWIQRLSDGNAIGSAFSMGTFPDTDEGVQFHIAGNDTNPNSLNESYAVWWLYSSLASHSFRQVLYSFWMEPVGT